MGFFRTASFQMQKFTNQFLFNGIVLPKHYQEFFYDNDIIIDILNIKFGTTYAYEGFTQLIWLFLFFIFTIFSPNLKEIIIEKKYKNLCFSSIFLLIHCLVV